jgi:hypothetical protein
MALLAAAGAMTKDDRQSYRALEKLRARSYLPGGDQPGVRLRKGKRK